MAPHTNNGKNPNEGFFNRYSIIRLKEKEQQNTEQPDDEQTVRAKLAVLDKIEVFYIKKLQSLDGSFTRQRNRVQKHKDTVYDKFNPKTISFGEKNFKIKSSYHDGTLKKKIAACEQYIKSDPKDGSNDIVNKKKIKEILEQYKESYEKLKLIQERKQTAKEVLRSFSQQHAQ